MRTHGLVNSAAGLGVHDHACWAYEDDAQFLDGVIQYLDDGRRHGKQLAYVADKPAAAMRADLWPLGDVDAMIAAGSLRLLPLRDVYEVGRPIDPRAQLAVYADATSAALRTGHTGLQVAGDATTLVRDRALWATHARWEAVADAYMAKNPFSALCSYDMRVVDDEMVATLSRLHPVANAPAAIAPFRLFSGGDGLMLAGEVDLFCAEELERLLALMPPSAELVLDLADLDFIDHHGIERILSHGRRLEAHGGRLTLHGVPPTMRRVCALLEEAA